MEHLFYLFCGDSLFPAMKFGDEGKCLYLCPQKRCDMPEQTEKTPKYINLLTDYGFKRVFGNAEVMTAFLNDLLEPASRICSVTFLDKEMGPPNKYERGVVYDLRCRLEDGSEIIVEMQKGEQEFFADRILYYLSRSVAAQGYKGKRAIPGKPVKKIDWDFMLKPVYGIFFMNFQVADLPSAPLREIGFYVKGTGQVFCDKIRAYTIELPEYQRNREADCKDKIEYWTYIINNMEKFDTMPFLSQMPIFGKVENLASMAALTPEDFEAYQNSVDAYRTTMASLEFHEKKGRAEGEAIGMKKGEAIGMKKGEALGMKKGEAIGMKKGEAVGMKKGRAEGEAIGMEKGEAVGMKKGLAMVVKSMKAMGMSLEQIAQATGLTEEDIHYGF